MLNKEQERLLKKVQKPARYTGGEVNSVVKDGKKVKCRFAFCFPDSYEIGMSHLGMKILYSLVNEREDAWCERVFAPWVDMERELRAAGLPLYALESGDSLADFDLIGFTLQYELCYTNVLNMLDLAGLPVYSADRKGLKPIVIAGGPCACNPEPLADFVDLFLPGEGEEVLGELIDLLIEHKEKGSSKTEFLRAAAKLAGVYVPAFYEVSYREDGTILKVVNRETAPAKVEKRLISDLDSVCYPEKFVVPFIDIVHDRAVAELFRGCIRGCRFCQAGFIGRPVREKSHTVVNRQARALCASTGYDELSLCSLSTSDYTQLDSLLPELLSWALRDRVNVSLPSLRVDNISDGLLAELKKVRRSGLTFAPEAGTQRLRDVINKNVTEEDVLRAARMAFEEGWTAVKLYFMIGLPTETPDDIAGIAQLAQKVVDLYYSNPAKPKGRSVTVSVSAASFVPKPFTPFQWEPQDTMEVLAAKQKLLMENVRSRKIQVSWHEPQASFLEAVLARGDRRLCAVIRSAWKKGCRFDGWDEFFDFEKWSQAFADCGVRAEFYANRRRAYDEVLPWDHLDFGLRKSYLIAENERAYKNLTTPNCRQKCGACGAEGLCGGKCHAGR